MTPLPLNPSIEPLNPFFFSPTQNFFLDPSPLQEDIEAAYSLYLDGRLEQMKLQQEKLQRKLEKKVSKIVSLILSQSKAMKTMNLRVNNICPIDENLQKINMINSKINRCLSEIYKLNNKIKETEQEINRINALQEGNTEIR